jgi:hypothetical protein
MYMYRRESHLGKKITQKMFGTWVFLLWNKCQRKKHSPCLEQKDTFAKFYLDFTPTYALYTHLHKHALATRVC